MREPLDVVEVVGNGQNWFFLFKPLLIFIDWAHQKEILRGIKKRVETANTSDT
jgi:hypothetical protein